MIFRFGPFVLHTARRELCRDGHEVAVQPRVFDVLTYLLEHRERVVSKDELLDHVWDDIHVTEGSLQRAVSVARRVLREGGVENALRVYPRQGYRFCAETTVENPDSSGAEALARARGAFAASGFEEAASAFAEADRDADLGGVALENWAESLWEIGRLSDAVGPLERAIAAHSAVGDQRGAARAALLLCKIHIERKTDAVAAGWLRQAERLLVGQERCLEYGLFCWTSGRMAAVRGDHRAALEASVEAHAIARQFDDPDLEGLALLDRGLWHQALGDTAIGVRIHDEAAALALSGALSPRVVGLVYCGVIWSCRNRGDWRRAGQWSDEFTRYCGRLGVDGFPGLCSLHRAELLHVRGDLETARAEAEKACDRLPEVAPWAEGEGHRIRGDIELTRGDLDAAQDAFQRAHELGWEPQPGQALLLVARGRAEAGLRGLERAVAATDWANQQRRALLFGHLAVVAVAAEQLERAEQALEEMAELPVVSETPALQALSHVATAVVAAARGDHAAAIGRLRAARALWLELGAPLEVARVNLTLGELLADTGDLEGAELELTSAGRISERSGAGALARLARELFARLEDRASD